MEKEPPMHPFAELATAATRLGLQLVSLSKDPTTGDEHRFAVKVGNQQLGTVGLGSAYEGDEPPEWSARHHFGGTTVFEPTAVQALLWPVEEEARFPRERTV
jgi:hypothetical protein